MAYCLAIISLLISCVAVIISYRSHIVAKQSFLIVEEQAKGRSPLLVPYLIDSSVITSKDSLTKIYAFSISLTNRSDLDNSIIDIQLKINYHRPEQPNASLIFPHNMNIRTCLIKDNSNILPLPLDIQAHGTITGGILFKCNSKTLDEVIIDSYEISFVDSNGLRRNLQPIVIMEIIDEE